MLLDAQNLLSDDQAITASAASTNALDLGANGTDALGNTVIGDAGRSLASKPGADLLIQVTEDFTAAGAATLTVGLQTDNDSAFGSPTDVATTLAIGKAELVAGKQISLPIPPGITERYIRAYYTVATGPMTAGKITAGIVMDRQSNPSVVS